MMGDSTTNQIKRSFWTLESHTKNKFRTLPFIGISIIELIKFISLRLKKAIGKTAQKVYRIIEPNPEIRE